MGPTRRLTLRRDALADLTADELRAAVAGTSLVVCIETFENGCVTLIYRLTCLCAL